VCERSSVLCALPYPRPPRQSAWGGARIVVRCGALAASLFVGQAAFAGDTDPAGAQAEPRVEVEVHYEVPEGCPSREAFGDAVRERAPLATISPAQPGLERVRVVVTTSPRSRGGLTGSLVLEGDSASARSFEAASCADVVRALALALALHLTSRQPREPEPRQSVRPEATTPAPRPEPAPPRTPIASRSPWVLGVDLGGGARTGVAPGISPAAILAVEISRERGLPFSVLLSILYGSAETPRLGFRHVVGGLDVCVPWVRPSARWAFAPCARLEAGAHVAVGASSTAEPWLAAGVVGRARLMVVRSMFVEGAVGPVVPVVSPRFTEVYGRVREVALEPSVVALFSSISVGVSFP
jgi:hypothetical protein